jgi:hypothetical protein
VKPIVDGDGNIIDPEEWLEMQAKMEEEKAEAARQKAKAMAKKGNPDR